MTEQDKDRIVWESDAGIFGHPDAICHLCKVAPGTVYRKSHKRQNGVHLESGVKYCEECNANCREECDQDFKKWWEKEWAECEAHAEDNWQKHGVYTNVVGSEKHGPGGCSTYFGYVKLPDGTFREYRFEHPETYRDLFERNKHDESDRIVEDVPEEQQFQAYSEFLKKQQQEIKWASNIIESEIKKLEDHLKPITPTELEDL